MTGQVAFVTGAGSGIGRACALHLARAGAAVLAGDLDEAAAGETVRRVEAEGGVALAHGLDVADGAAVERAVATAVAELGGLDVAVNNAGVSGRPHLLHETPLEEWDRVVAVNLSGTFSCLRAELRHMVGQGHGAIVNIASTAGIIGATGLAAYTATKHGVVGLTRTAAVDYASRGIRVNVLCPGPVRTEMLEGLMAGDVGRRAALEGASPTGRLGSVDEVAAAAAFLCSAAASFLNGVVLPVDGGRTAGPHHGSARG